MGSNGYYCGFGSFILFAGFVILAFGLVPNAVRKLDPECYTGCEYGVSEYRKNVKDYCKAAAAFCIVVGFILCLYEYVAWRCRRGDCFGDNSDLHLASIEDGNFVNRTVPESSYYYTTTRGDRIPINRNDDHNSSTRHDRRLLEDTNDRSNRYYDGSTAPLVDEQEPNQDRNNDPMNRRGKNYLSILTVEFILHFFVRQFVCLSAYF